jgi:hypothetical protein
MTRKIIEGIERELKQLELRIKAPRKWRAVTKEAGAAERDVTDEVIAQERALAKELQRWLTELKKLGK